MKNKILKFFNNKKTISYIIIILASIFICIPMFTNYMDISRDDGIQHICRIIGTHQSIKEKGFFSLIMSNFCNDFGYSWNIFYSPLTAYLPLIFTLFTKSYVMCLKLFMFFTMLLSGIFMYKLVYTISRSYKASVISAIIYICAPYHLTDLYSRVAIAELASFMFLPVVFIGLYDLLNKKGEKSLYISIGAIGLIISHNVLAIYTAIFCFIYLVLNYKKLQNKIVIKSIVKNILIILLCTSFYWVPLLQHYFATTYEVFVEGRMYQNNTLISSKLSITNLLYTKHYGMIFYIGLPILMGISLLFIYRDKISKKYKYTIFTFLVFGLISTIMSLKMFPFEYLPNFLKMIQFQWRMLEFSSFFLSIVSGIALAIFLNSKCKVSLKNLIILLLTLYTIILLKDSFYKVEVPFNEENYIKPVLVTNLTGRVHPGLASFEYLPQKAFLNRKYIETRAQEVLVLEGNANIINQNKNGTDLDFEIENNSRNTKIELPYIYYLGYNAKITYENGEQKNIKIAESDNGFCMVEISNTGKANIQVEYTGTTLMKISYIVSLLTFIVILYLNYRNNIKFILHRLTIHHK